jgi:ADP-dependent phosphofructokinase/glucokinase
MTATDWAQAYSDLIAGLSRQVQRGRLMLAGFSACVDVYLSLHDVDPVEAAKDRAAQALLTELKRRAAAGIGGEVLADWPEGPRWMARHMKGRVGLGGTSAQASELFATLGAPALLALGDRSRDQLAVIHPDVCLATGRGLTRRSEIEPQGSGPVPHYIFEYTAGREIDGKVLPRSSRVIVRFADSSLQHDKDFERLSIDLAGSAGAGIISGFNELPPVSAKAEQTYARRIAEAWRARGLGIVHLELGDYPSHEMRDEALVALAPAATSFGASLSELDSLLPSRDPIEARAMRVGEEFGFTRVSIHADQWALAATRGDAETEAAALMTGCLAASARAHAGYFTFPRAIPPGADFIDPPLPRFTRRNGWSIVCCPAPYLARPKATIGLGDTFLAGTLLVLGASPAGG